MHHKINFMSRKVLLAFVSILFFGLQTVVAQESANVPARDTVQEKGKSLGTLTIGGYGEAVYKYNFFSDNVFRYSHAANYADSKGHGRVDLPHGSAQSDARWTVEKFRNLSKEDRDAVVKFINAI